MSTKRSVAFAATIVVVLCLGGLLAVKLHRPASATTGDDGPRGGDLARGTDGPVETTYLHLFGTRAVGGRVRHMFMLHNATAEPMVVDRVEVSCGCLTPQVPAVVPPFSRTGLVLDVQLPDLPGPFDATATVYFADGTDKAFHLRGDLMRRVPKHLELGRVRRDEPSTSEFFINSVDGGPMTIKSIQSDAEGLTATSVLVSADGSRHRVSIRLAPAADAPSGAFAHELRITTSEADQPPAGVEIAGRVLGAVELEESKLAVGTAEGDEWVAGTLRVRVPYADPSGAPPTLISAVANPSEALRCDPSRARWDGMILSVPFEMRHLGQSSVEAATATLTVDPDATGLGDPQAAEARLFLMGRTTQERAEHAMPGPAE